jgi:hypothetical protein
MKSIPQKVQIVHAIFFLKPNYQKYNLKSHELQKN